ncbi:MAG: hypothetical protein AB1306_01660 [Nitrospirota bacterium]
MKSLRVFAIIIFLGIGSFFVPSEAQPHDIDFSIGINIGAPPRQVVVSGSPALYSIPGTPVYYVPEVSRQIYFYSNNWYRLYNGYWYRASFYNGPWIFLQPESLPVVFTDLSPAYYIYPPREVYRPYWKHKAYWREREERHEERREHLHRHHEREHDAWRDYKEEKRWKRGRNRS